MSASPDDLVHVLSRWLAGHVGTEEVRQAIGELDAAGLSADQAEAVEELREELASGTRGAGHVNRVVRETLEALALG